MSSTSTPEARHQPGSLRRRLGSVSARVAELARSARTRILTWWRRGPSVGRERPTIGRADLLPAGRQTAQTLTGALAVVTVAASALGLRWPTVYRDSASVTAMYRGMDAVNLAVAAPCLLLAPRIARAGSTTAHLVWAGALGYALYTYVLYVFGLSLNALFLLHVAALTLALYSLMVLLARTDREALTRRWQGASWGPRAAGAVLGLLGLSLGSIWTYYAARFALTGAAPQESLLVQTPAGIHLSYAADLVLVVPAYLLSGVLLWRRLPWGYLLGGTLLTSGLLQQVGYVAELLSQDRAAIPGARRTDPHEPGVVAAYLLGIALLLGGPRPRPRPATTYPGRHPATEGVPA